MYAEATIYLITGGEKINMITILDLQIEELKDALQAASGATFAGCSTSTSTSCGSTSTTTSTSG
jgi:hypothetical protein